MSTAVAILALVGAPVGGEYAGWYVYRGRPWGESGWLMERVAAGIAIALCVFNGWLDICDKLMKMVGG